MSESLASRVGRLVSATAHALVEAVENMAPEMAIEEAIREVDGAIDDVRSELGLTLSRQHMASKRLAEENRRHDDLSEKIGVALAEGRDDLAEAAVGQLIDIEAQIPVIEETLAETRKLQGQLEGFVSALQARKREMAEELAHFRAAAREAEAALAGDPAEGGILPGGKVDTALRRADAAFGKAVETAGGVAGSARIPSPEIAGLRSELDDLARKNRIKERLEAFKAK